MIARPTMTDTTAASPDLAEYLNENVQGWNKLMGLRLVRATADEVVAEITADERHHQPYGLVHGGVYASMIETVCSVGAAAWALPQNLSVVGLDNHTSFLHAAREGRLTIVAKPLSRGRRTHLWEATVTDEGGRVCATGRVRLVCLAQGARVAGETVAVKHSEPAR